MNRDDDSENTTVKIYLSPLSRSFKNNLLRHRRSKCSLNHVVIPAQKPFREECPCRDCGTHDNENVAQTSCLQAGSPRYRIFVVIAHVRAARIIMKMQSNSGYLRTY
jgi:hypothetical protein